MILDSRCGVRGMLIDADTGRPIRFARWANLATGEYERLAAGFDGKPVAPARIIRGKGRLQFVQRGRAAKITDPTAVDAKAAREEADEYRRKTEPRLLVPGDECEAKGCHRLAGWSVAIERVLTPVRQPGGALHEHGVIVAVKSFCDAHYRLPVVIGRTGVESEASVAARPQW